MISTKEDFFKAVNIPSGNFRVYVETKSSREAANLFVDRAPESFDPCAGFVDGKNMFFIHFPHDKKQEADNYAAKCRAHPSGWLVEGPTLT